MRQNWLSNRVFKSFDDYRRSLLLHLEHDSIAAVSVCRDWPTRDIGVNEFVFLPLFLQRRAQDRLTIELPRDRAEVPNITTRSHVLSAGVYLRPIIGSFIRRNRKSHDRAPLARVVTTSHQQQGECDMNSKSKIALGVVVGAALGAVAVQGLHAQAKPKAYIVTEIETLDVEAQKAYAPLNQAAQKAAGGRNLGTAGGKIVPLVGDPPKRVGITEWDSLEQALAYRNGKAWKELSPQRDKAQKTVRQFVVEAVR